MSEWKEMYEGRYLTIIGIHTPEFEREKDLARLRKQMKDHGIEYPVVTDNEFKSWNAYEQHYWPMMNLIDKKGMVRYIHIGEGRYEAIRRKIEEPLCRLLSITKPLQYGPFLMIMQMAHAKKNPVNVRPGFSTLGITPGEL